MKLESLHLSNFSVIRDANFGFSPEINVFLGRNGAGKSHLMKLLYAVLRARRDSPEVIANNDFAGTLKKKLVGVFRPESDAIGRMVSRGVGRRKAGVILKSNRDTSGKHFEINFNWSTLGNLTVETNTFPRVEPSVFCRRAKFWQCTKDSFRLMKKESYLSMRLIETYAYS
jgi:DNA repair ATPase RecN